MPDPKQRPEIDAMLRSGDFTGFVGSIEVENFECKGSPYQLDQIHQKQELAKDVAGMANAGGGYIVIGLATRIDAMRAVEEVSELKEFPASLVDLTQYEGILASWIYPRIEGVEVRFWPSAADSGKGVASIFIPNQAADRKPFLVVRTIADDGKKVETVFGHFERRRANVDHTTIERLHSLLQAGMQSHRVNVQLSSMQDLLEQLAARVDEQNRSPVAPVSPEELERRIRHAILAAELDDVPSYTLAMRPVEHSDIPTLARSSSEPVVQLLNDPGSLLEISFHLKASASKSHMEGQRRRSLEAKEALLELWRDGTLIAVMRGDASFLCWASKGEGMTVNPYVLIDTVCEFVTLARVLSDHTNPKIREVEFSIRLEGMIQEQPSQLGTVFFRTLRPSGSAPDNELSIGLPANLEEESTGAIAYKIVAAVYRWYGLTEEYIPNVEMDASNKRLESVDLKKVTAPR